MSSSFLVREANGKQSFIVRSEHGFSAREMQQFCLAEDDIRKIFGCTRPCPWFFDENNISPDCVRYVEHDMGNVVLDIYLPYYKCERGITRDGTPYSKCIWSYGMPSIRRFELRHYWDIEHPERGGILTALAYDEEYLPYNLICAKDFVFKIGPNPYLNGTLIYPAHGQCTQITQSYSSNGVNTQSNNNYGKAIDTTVKPLIVVLGLHCSLSSALAMAMEELGIFMGKKTKGGESQALALVLEGLYRFPSTRSSRTPCETNTILNKVITQHIKQSGDKPVGVKYPTLCALMENIDHNNLIIVDIARPLEDSIRSLVYRSTPENPTHPNCSSEKATNVQMFLHTKKRVFLKRSRYPYIRIGAETLVRKTEATLTRLCDFLGISPTKEQMDRAISVIDPNKVRHTKDVLKPKWYDDTTIIIKSYERHNELNRLIDQLLDRWPDVEILVADDSEKPYFRSEVTTYNLPNDTGLAHGRNYLIDRVKTRNVIIMDDDFILTDKTDLEYLHNKFNENNLDILAGDAIRNSRKTPFGILYKDDKILYQRAKEYSANGVTIGNYVPNFFIAKTSSLKRSRWDSRQKVGEHVDFFIRAKRNNLLIGFTPNVVVRDPGCVKSKNTKYWKHRQRAHKLHHEAIVRWCKYYGLTYYQNGFLKEYCHNKNIGDKSVVNIPKKIHQIWLGDKPIPEEQREWMNQWKNFNPDWDYVLWKQVPHRIIHPELLRLLPKCCGIAQQTDIIRLSILFKWGGIYLDTDFIPVQKLDTLLDYARNHDKEALVFKNGTGDYLGNGVIACVPQHPLIEHYIRLIPQYFNPNKGNSIGPPLLTLAYNEAKENFFDIGVMPNDVFYPIEYKRRGELEDSPLRFATDETVGIHTYAGQWH